MDTVLAQDARNEREWSGSRRRLGRYPRIFLMLLIALAFFGAVSAASSRDALAHTGWHSSLKSNGLTYQCYWTWNGYQHFEDGCLYYYGNQLPARYHQWSTGIHYIWNGAQWIHPSQYWSTTPATMTIGGYDANRAGITWWEHQSRIASNTTWLRSSTSTFSKASTASSGSDAEVTQPAPPPSSALRTTPESSTDSAFSKATFPWKVSQDKSGSFRYSGTAWKKVSSGKAQGGTYRVSTSQIRGAFFAAQGATDAGGSTMKLITATGPKMGTAKVLVVNLTNGTVAKNIKFDLKTSKPKYRVAKSITGLTPHRPYGLVVLSANGRPVVVDAVGYEAHGNLCHNVL